MQTVPSFDGATIAFDDVHLDMKRLKFHQLPWRERFPFSGLSSTSRELVKESTLNS